MKPEYGSHNEPDVLAVHRQPEEIGPIQHQEIPGLSVAQTEFFQSLQERFAKHKLALTVAPDGGMVTCEIGGSNDGKSHPWGSIHDERKVFQLINTMYDATLSREEVISLMFKLFPRSTELGFLFLPKGDN